MMEIIKLAKVYYLKALFNAAESHFRDIMFTCFDASNIFSLKVKRPQSNPSPTANSVRDALQSRRTAAQNNQNEIVQSRPNENVAANSGAAS